MNGSEEFKAGERLALIEADIKSCLKGIERIETIIVPEVKKNHDDIIALKKDMTVFKWVAGIVITPIVAQSIILLFRIFAKK